MLILNSCSTTTPFTVSGPTRENYDQTERVNIVAIGAEHVYEEYNVTLPYTFNIKYSHLPLRVHVYSDNKIYPPFTIRGHGRKLNVFAGIMGGVMAAVGTTQATISENTGQFIAAAVCYATSAFIFYAGTTNKEIGTTSFHLRKPSYYYNDTIRRLYEIEDIYKLSQKKSYDLALAKTKYLINKNKEKGIQNRMGELYYLLGACNLAKEEYDDAMTDLKMALIFDDATGDLEKNIYECYNIAQEAKEQHGKEVAERWSTVGNVLLSAGIAAVSTAIQVNSIPSNSPDALLDPRLAMAQASAQMEQQKQAFLTQYRNSFRMQWGRNPTQEEEMAAYNEFLKAQMDANKANSSSVNTNTSSNTSNSNNNSTDNSSSRTSCGFCNGTGRIVKDDAMTFGFDKKYCEECKKEVFTSHYHAPCPQCNGHGYK